MSAPKVCLVLGAGPGLGFSLGKRWSAEGFKVIMARRSAMTESQMSSVGENVLSVACDVTDSQEVEKLVDRIENEHGPIHTLLYNAGKGVWKKYQDLTIGEFEMSIASNATGLLNAAKAICPRMEARGYGIVGVTGATAALRGKPFTAGFAPAKAAQRMLAQSLARQLGPQGVHVFYVIVDGIIGPAGGDFESGKMDPEDIAESYWNIANQNKSSWTHEIDLRPFKENW